MGKEERVKQKLLKRQKMRKKGMKSKRETGGGGER